MYIRTNNQCISVSEIILLLVDTVANGNKSCKSEQNSSSITVLSYETTMWYLVKPFLIALIRLFVFYKLKNFLH